MRPTVRLTVKWWNTASGAVDAAGLDIRHHPVTHLVTMFGLQCHAVTHRDGLETEFAIWTAHD